MGMYFSFHGLGMPRYYGSMKEKEKANKMCFTSYQPAAPLTGTNSYNNQERRSCYLRPYLSIAFMILPRSPHCSVQLLEPSTAGLTGTIFIFKKAKMSLQLIFDYVSIFFPGIMVIFSWTLRDTSFT